MKGLQNTEEVQLSPDQRKAFDAIQGWLYQGFAKPLRIGGYAGTGKTTLIGYVRNYIRDQTPKFRVAFACPTGMASQNLIGRLALQGVSLAKDYVGTIHRLIYVPEISKKGQIVGWIRNEEINKDIIIVDEGSMITKSVWRDLTSFGIPLLVFGDHGQLPPVGDTYSLMKDPDLALETIHRQAADNPIINLATLARKGQAIPPAKYGSGVAKISRDSYEAEEISNSFFNMRGTDSFILCGTNKLRNQLNKHIRTMKGIESNEPVAGDTVVCLRNIYDNKGGAIFNGMLGEIKRISDEDKHRFSATIEFPDAGVTYVGFISKEQFHSPTLISQIKGVKHDMIGDRFDFGYALTVHKAQGSQARRVLVFDESPLFREDAHKWLYTAITRAEEELYILSN